MGNRDLSSWRALVLFPLLVLWHPLFPPPPCCINSNVSMAERVAFYCDAESPGTVDSVQWDPGSEGHDRAKCYLGDSISSSAGAVSCVLL